MDKWFLTFRMSSLPQHSQFMHFNKKVLGLQRSSTLGQQHPPRRLELYTDRSGDIGKGPQTNEGFRFARA